MMYLIRSKLENENSHEERDESFGCTVQRNILANGKVWKVILSKGDEHDGLIYYKICGTNGAEIHPGRTIVVYADHGSRKGLKGFHGKAGAERLVKNILEVLTGGVDWILFFVCQLEPWVDSNKDILNQLSCGRQLHIDYNSVPFLAAQINSSLPNLITRLPYYHILEKQITMTPGDGTVYYPPKPKSQLPPLKVRRR